MYYAVDDELDQLEHHGILGQKWGVRRFQREDGTRTAAGKRRERDDYDNAQNGGGSRGGFKVNKKAVAVVAGVAVGAALLAHPATRQALTKYGKMAVDKLPDAMKAAKGMAKETAKKGAKALGESGKRVGNAMLDAALLSVGAVEISNLERKLELPEDATQAEKDRNKIILDTAKAGIESATNPKGYKTSGGSNNKNGGGNVSTEVTNKLGPPSNKGVDKQSKEWGELFKGVEDAETRGTIKALAAKGYDMEQLQEYKKQFGHSALAEWANSFCYFPIRG